MKTQAFTLLVMTIMILPNSLRACDCGCDDPPKVIHFTDGIPSNGPITSVSGAANPEYYADAFGFRDYGPAHTTPAPAHVKQPNS